MYLMTMKNLNLKNTVIRNARACMNRFVHEAPHGGGRYCTKIIHFKQTPNKYTNTTELFTLFKMNSQTDVM